MKRLTIGGLAAACLGLGLYLVMAKQQPPEPTASPEPTPAVATTPAVPPTPVVLSEVVVVADLDPLLDPQVRPAGGVPFDPEPAAAPGFNFAPGRIPPAVEDETPLAADAPVPPTDPSRAVWYGPHRFPRQMGGGMSLRELRHDLEDHTERQKPVCIPGGFRCGVSFPF